MFATSPHALVSSYLHTFHEASYFPFKFMLDINLCTLADICKQLAFFHYLSFSPILHNSPIFSLQPYKIIIACKILEILKSGSLSLVQILSLNVTYLSRENRTLIRDELNLNIRHVYHFQLKMLKTINFHVFIFIEWLIFYF